MSLAWHRVNLHRHLALRGGVSILRGILAKNKNHPGLTTEELYKLALEEPPPAGYYNPHLTDGVPFPPMPAPSKKGKPKQQSPPPPNMDHPVRSKAFLKNEILSFLQGSNELQKTRSERIVDKAELFKIKKGKKVPLYADQEGTAVEQIWVWKPIEQAILKETPPIPEPVPVPDVGADEDLSHLSKRRATERRAQIRKDTHMAKVLEGIKKQQLRSMAGAMLRKSQAAKKEQLEKLRADGKVPERPREASSERFDRNRPDSARFDRNKPDSARFDRNRPDSTRFDRDRPAHEGERTDRGRFERDRPRPEGRERTDRGRFERDRPRPEGRERADRGRFERDRPKPEGRERADQERRPSRFERK
ncbi:hypothetical protein C0991_007489 [Blastosporella zonata]|nr:hypothetical protein C0991_007489 [Blastosporella zonata]